MELLKLMLKAIDGDFDAIYELSDIFTKDGKEEFSVYWLKYACEQNNDDAMYRLGVKYTCDEKSPVYNLAEGNALLAESAYLGNNSARMYFARHIFDKAPERLYERAVKMLLDAIEDGVDEAKTMLDNFFEKITDRDAAWKSTVAFEYIKKAADVGCKYASQLCGLVMVGNEEYIVFDTDHCNLNEALKYIEKGAKEKTPVSSYLYAKIMMHKLEDIEEYLEKEDLLYMAKKCELVYEVRDVVLESFNYEDQYTDFYLKYAHVLYKLCMIENQAGDRDQALKYAEAITQVYTTSDAVFERDTAGSMCYFDAVMMLNGIKLKQEQARFFRWALQNKEHYSPKNLDKLIVCYVSYMVLINEYSTVDELVEAKGFLQLYSESASDEYHELMEYLDNRIN